jgi:hypothetical protein
MPFPAKSLTYPAGSRARLKHLFFGTTGLFFQILTPGKFHPFLFPITPRYNL